MGSFVIVIVLIIILSIIFRGKGDRRKISLLCICFLLLVGLKISVVWNEWGDLPSYNLIFQHTLTHDLSYYHHYGWDTPDVKSEIGWTFYTWLNSSISSNFYFLLLTTGFTTLLGYFYSIYKFIPSHYLCLSILIYIIGPYLQSFYVLRQHLAMALMLFSYPYIIGSKPIKFLFITLLSFAIHQSAIFVVPLYILYNIKNRKIFCLSIISYSAILFTIILYVGNTADLIVDGYNTYLRAKEEEFSNYKSAALLLGVLLVRVLILKNKMFNEGITRLLSIILIIGSINAFIAVGRVAFMSRLNMYYSELIFLVLPNTISFLNIKFYRIAIAFSYLLIMGLYFFMRYNTYLTGRFIWD